LTPFVQAMLVVLLLEIVLHLSEMSLC